MARRHDHTLAKPHDFIAGVCRWCAMRAYWAGAKDACAAVFIRTRIEHGRKRRAEKQARAEVRS